MARIKKIVHSVQQNLSVVVDCLEWRSKTRSCLALMVIIIIIIIIIIIVIINMFVERHKVVTSEALVTVIRVPYHL